MSSRPTYSGSKARLAIAIDIGTTYSGASYTFLNPGEVPRIFDVIGFKLKLRPASMRIDTPPITLPPGRTVVDIFGDFLKYMYDCVRAHIVKSHADGEQLWLSLHDSAHIILSHPNGWGSLQQSRMRQAAIEGGLVPNTSEGKERIEFVTEGEASFHWCVEQTVAEKALQAGTKIVVADLGGGTIDVSSFRVVNPKPLRLQEALGADCVVAGSITVTDRFVKTIRARLQGTPYDDQDSMETLREEFDDETKCLFRDESDESLYIRIGGRRDHYQDDQKLCRIEYGILEVQRNEVEQAFETSIQATVQAIKTHVDGQENTYIFLVGGFAASPWVLSETDRRLKEMGITCAVNRADSNTSKAVAHGGVAFYLDRYITERTMRFTYGLILGMSYDPTDPEHAKRAHKLRTDPISGRVTVPGGFRPLVRKGELVKVESVYRESVTSQACQIPEIHSWEQYLVRYSGSIEDITFMDMDPSAFDIIGWFECEMPATAMTRRRGKHGTYWQPQWEVVITLGTVEIKCHVEWNENGARKRWVMIAVIMRPSVMKKSVQKPGTSHLGGLLLNVEEISIEWQI
ncbi:hypothetical protein M407DRAFT_23293 [Tulasnella calospora MUT 4182]|uniref:Uncharacterized protein n=1 Tax=Tulasnella calospora MUT 4182 TaxID=1051891 RepID=A0A0C3L183_9AGAM|nr:hypothetical protein M407DRAFT_23293 [Tulasnella calospora MUT 4182]